MSGHMNRVTSCAARWHNDRSAWAFIGSRYIPVLAVLNFVWEVAHLPLYTLWEAGTVRSISFAVFHCTLGDILIGVFALLAALIVTGAGRLCDWRWRTVSGVTVLFGVGYTAFSEWVHTAVRLSWEYSSEMPIVPVVKLGVSPLLQWVVVPMAAVWLARRSVLWPQRKCGYARDCVTVHSKGTSTQATSASDLEFMTNEKEEK